MDLCPLGPTSCNDFKGSFSTSVLWLKLFHLWIILPRKRYHTNVWNMVCWQSYKAKRPESPHFCLIYYFAKSYLSESLAGDRWRGNLISHTSFIERNIKHDIKWQDLFQIFFNWWTWLMYFISFYKKIKINK